LDIITQDATTIAPDYRPDPKDLAKRFLPKESPVVIDIPEEAPCTANRVDAPYIYASFLTYHTPSARDIKTVIKKPNSKWTTSFLPFFGVRQSKDLDMRWTHQDQKISSLLLIFPNRHMTCTRGDLRF